MPPTKTSVDGHEQVEVTSRKQWRAWLKKHHARDRGIWLVVYKKHCGKKHVSWDDVVEEALCYGWIDSRTRRVDEDRMMFLVSPRRPGSTWSSKNKAIVADLEDRGLMTELGRAKIEAARADGSWTWLDDVEQLIEPPDLQKALARSKRARAQWEAFPGSARKIILYWIKSAKKEETRKTRISETARLAALGLKAAHPEARGK